MVVYGPDGTPWGPLIFSTFSEFMTFKRFTFFVNYFNISKRKLALTIAELEQNIFEVLSAIINSLTLHA